MTRELNLRGNISNHPSYGAALAAVPPDAHVEITDGRSPVRIIDGRYVESTLIDDAGRWVGEIVRADWRPEMPVPA